MIEAIKRTLLAGVGAAVITKEKAETALSGLVAQGKVTAREARTVAEQLARDGRREFASVSAEVGDALDEIVLASASRADAQLQRMRERLRAMEQETRPSTPRPRPRRPKARRVTRRTRPKRRVA